MAEADIQAEPSGMASACQARLRNARCSVVHFLLRMLQHHPGKVIDQAGRKYIVDDRGAWRRLGREV